MHKIFAKVWSVAFLEKESVDSVDMVIYVMTNGIYSWFRGMQKTSSFCIGNILRGRNILSHVTKKSRDGSGFCTARSRYSNKIRRILNLPFCSGCFYTASFCRYAFSTQRANEQLIFQTSYLFREKSCACPQIPYCNLRQHPNISFESFLNPTTIIVAFPSSSVGDRS